MSDLVYEGTQSAPTAGTVIVQSAALSSGRYRVMADVHLEGSGTPAAADLDNMALFSDTTQIGVLSVPEAKAVEFATPEFLVDVAAGKKISIQAVGNATLSVVYAASLRIRIEALF